MLHQTFPETDASPADPPAGALTAAAQAELAGIVGRLDSHFMPAGSTLARLVETVGHVLAGLDGVARAMGDQGVGSGAVENLMTAAGRLYQAPARQGERARQVVGMLKITQQLSGISAEIARVLSMLQFYTVNLKIAAAGGDEFVEFANDMSLRLSSGSEEVEAFKREVARMLSGLGELRALDDVLARECARVVPAVPDRLVGEVEALRAQQAGTAAASQAARTIVMRLQAGIGRALGAIQIGDITRQRLEHVLDGCVRFDAAQADPALADADGARGHMLRLFAAQVADLTQDFDGEAGTLLDALDALAPDCDALLAQAERSAGGGAAAQGQDSGMFLRDLDECITGAQGMTGQLHRADVKAAEIAHVVRDVAQSLRDRVGVIETLRSEVDYMAINVNIRARQARGAGRPVAVISEEIRVCAQQLSDLTQGITSLADDLGAGSAGFGTDNDAGEETGGPGIGEALTTALAIIREAAQEAGEALGQLDANARDIVAMIRIAADDLSVCVSLADTLRAMSAGFAEQAGPATPRIAPDGEHQVVAQMAALARSYTMAQERAVHDRFLLPGMEPLLSAAPPVSAAASAGDDDDMDDVFL